MSNILTAENVTVVFGSKEVLYGAFTRIEKGKITALLGRNGSGKSTFLKAIFGTQPSADKVLQLNGLSIKKDSYTIKDFVNYMPQFRFLPGHRTVRKILQDFNVAPGAVLHDFPDLATDIDMRMNELSGGRERLWTLMVLLMADTKFTMLDEPFTHIMPLHIEKLKQVLLREKLRKGILITDHMYRHVLEISDDVHLIKDGRTLHIRSKEDLALHQYIAADSTALL